MEDEEQIDRAIDVALDRTKDAQARVSVELDEGAVDSAGAAVVARRAEDLDELAGDAAELAIAGEHGDGGSPPAPTDDPPRSASGPPPPSSS